MILCRRIWSIAELLLPLGLFALVLPFDAVGPKAPAGFRTELILAAPDIQHPSVVTCDDDGNVFVGEDPMDMRGPTSEPIDRVLFIRWDKNGGPPKKTVFCDGLSAVFGLAWHRGALYVMHAPHYSMFVDTDGDGVADARKDLAHGFGPPAGKYEFNDHIVSGIRLGMDGLMYVSVGDKGIPLATGADGSTITLEGGGIIRMRPDGTQLELVSTGTRNHLDVAMDEFDNLFTYDNTDDGLGWWTRFTHQIPTGYYGYPYDYRAHPERHLPPVSEHGPGAPAGSAGYLEAAWPEKYRGNVFCCEWGKRRIRRFTLRPAGASFDAGMEDFLERIGDDEFRPLDLCFSPDGRHMYVADWNFAGWVKPDVAGRLYRITYVGHDVVPEPPRATDGEPIEAQIRALAHPARSERMRAQWNLANRAEAAIQPVAAALKSNPEKLARIHAIWTQHALMDRIVAYDPARDWISALRDNDADVRAQAARALGLRRFGSAAAALSKALDDADGRVRLQAAVALGRLGDPAPARELVAALDEQDIHVRFAVMQALRNLRAWEAVIDVLASTKPAIRQSAILTATGVFDVGAVKVLVRAATAMPNPDERALALAALAEVHRQPAPYDGSWWGGRPAAGKPARPKEIEWPGTALVLQVLRESLDVQNPSVAQLAAIKAFREVPDPAALAPLRSLAGSAASVNVRREAIATLAALEDRDSAPLFTALAGDTATDNELREAAVRAIVALHLADSAPCLSAIVAADESSEGLVALALEGLAQIGSAEIASVIEPRLTDPRPAIRARAVHAWAAVFGSEGTARLVQFLRDDHDIIVRKSVIEALGRLGARVAIPAIIEAANEPALKFEVQSALASMPDRGALPFYLEGLVSPNADLRSQSREALIAIRKEVGHEILHLHRQNRLSVNVRRALQPVFGAPNGGPDPRFGALFDELPPSPDQATYAEFAKKTKGSATRGREIFADRQGVGCIKCHAVKGEGGMIGPDLAGVGALNRRDELVKAVLDPSDRIAQSYEQTTIVTIQGKVLSGMVKGESRASLELQNAEGILTRVPVAEIEERVKSRISLMPAGLYEGMTLEDFADIVAYLENLKDSAPAIRR